MMIAIAITTTTTTTTTLQMHKVKFDKDEKIRKLNENPDDPEAQKEIEEMVRMENVQRNMEVAMEEMPEVRRGGGKRWW